MGVDVRIVDKATEPSTTSRALGVQARTLELLRPRGVADEMLRAGQPGAPPPRCTRTAGSSPASNSHRMPSEFNFILMLAQSETERLLAEQLGRQGVKVERGVEFVSLAEHPDSVDVTLAAPDGREVVEASYVIAADGSHSPVRKALGLPFTGRSLPQNYVLGDVHLDRRRARGSAVDLPGAQRAFSPYSRWAAADSGSWRPTPTASPATRDEPTLADIQTLYDRTVARPRPAARSQLEFAVPDQQPAHGHAAPGPGVLRRRRRARAQPGGRPGHERGHPGHDQPVVEARDGAATGRRGPNCSTPTSPTGCP